VPDDKDRAAVATLMSGTFPSLAPQEIARVVGIAAPLASSSA